MIDQATVTPGAQSGSYGAKAGYSNALFLGTGQWALVAYNGNGCQAVTVAVSVHKIPAYQ
jgi:hypothetical protein